MSVGETVSGLVRSAGDQVVGAVRMEADGRGRRPLVPDGSSRGRHDPGRTKSI